MKYVNEVAVTLGSLLGRFRRPAPVENSKAPDGKTPDGIPRGFTPIPEFLPEDIFIVGYPRSGNTWFENLVLSAVYGVDPRWMPNGLAQELVPTLRFQATYIRLVNIIAATQPRCCSIRTPSRGRNAAGLCTCCGMGATYWFPIGTIARRLTAWITTF
jgi:hypothetical protein